MKNANMPAMPCEVTEIYHVDVSQVPSGLSPAEDFTARNRKVVSSGMTKREMMAMHMMQGILTGQDTNEMVVGDDKCFAEFAVQCADALIAELERTK